MCQANTIQPVNHCHHCHGNIHSTAKNNRWAWHMSIDTATQTCGQLAQQVGWTPDWHYIVLNDSLSTAKTKHFAKGACVNIPLAMVWCVRMLSQGHWLGRELYLSLFSRVTDVWPTQSMVKRELKSWLQMNALFVWGRTSQAWLKSVNN